MRNAVDILTELAELYDNECCITKRKFKPKGFVIHHLWYYKKGDVERKNYPKTPKGRTQYYMDLEPLVRKEPERFILITNGMHTRIDHKIRGLSRLKKETLIRLFMVCLLTEKDRR